MRRFPGENREDEKGAKVRNDIRENVDGTSNRPRDDAPAQQVVARTESSFMERISSFLSLKDVIYVGRRSRLGRRCFDDPNSTAPGLRTNARRKERVDALDGDEPLGWSGGLIGLHTRSVTVIVSCRATDHEEAGYGARLRRAPDARHKPRAARVERRSHLCSTSWGVIL